MYPLVACVGRVGRRTPRFWVERGEKNLISGSGTQFYVQLLFFWHSGRFLCPLNRSVGRKKWWLSCLLTWEGNAHIHPLVPKAVFCNWLPLYISYIALLHIHQATHTNSSTCTSTSCLRLALPYRLGAAFPFSFSKGTAQGGYRKGDPVCEVARDPSRAIGVGG